MEKTLKNLLNTIDEDFYIDEEKFKQLCNSLNEETKTQLLNILIIFQNINYVELFELINK